jgi:hypothetical protein
MASLMRGRPPRPEAGKGRNEPQMNADGRRWRQEGLATPAARRAYHQRLRARVRDYWPDEETPAVVSAIPVSFLRRLWRRLPESSQNARGDLFG